MHTCEQFLNLHVGLGLDFFFVNVCVCVFEERLRNDLGPIPCRVGCKTLTQSINQSRRECLGMLYRFSLKRCTTETDTLVTTSR